MAITTTARSRRFLASALSVAALSAGFLSVGGAANAAIAEAPGAPSSPVQSCSYDLGTGSLVCVDDGDDLNEAVLEQQHLLVVAPSGARGATVDALAAPAALAALASAKATFVQAQLFDDAGYGGSFFQITNSSACNGSTVWYFGPLGNVGWSGRVSSFKSFSNCTTKLWQGTNYTGASYGYSGNAANLGSMNDKANSVTVR
ncbi:hypothetical protein [Leifsonia sp. Le1]|uniref:hypothetical protein n=1 Tax=Leifsonia sp. Le1 TaxID=3404918 RepID=UPI003EBB2DDD